MKKILDILWQEQEILAYSDIVNGRIVQWLLDTLSNDYWTHCPMIIGHIVQWLLDKLSNIYRTESKVSKEYSTLGPPNIGQFYIPWSKIYKQGRFDTLFNDYWTHCSMTIGHIVQWLLDTLSNNYRTWLLDTLSNDYWKHCPMIIGHIVQWLVDKLSNIYRTEYKVSKE